MNYSVVHCMRPVNEPVVSDHIESGSIFDFSFLVQKRADQNMETVDSIRRM